MQELSAMEQRFSDAAASAASVSSVRAQLEAQLLRSDDACAEAEARGDALSMELAELQVRCWHGMACVPWLPAQAAMRHHSPCTGPGQGEGKAALGP